MENKTLKNIELYTDGACSYNPGPGGYGIILKHNGFEKEFSGFVENTTNNQMELKAVIEGLKKIKEKCHVTIFTDSAYVYNAFNNGWITNWLNNGWKNSKKQDVLNKDLWMELLIQINNHEISWVKVKGHSDNVYNNRCDKLATTEIKNNMS